MTQHQGLPPAAAARIEFHRPSEAARILRIGQRQIYQAIASGQIRAIKLGGQFRIPEGEIARLRRGESIVTA
jgi:excisionase family DNA binding protein